MSELVVERPEGLYCPAGGFHIDPWRPVARALVTHAHADHARPGHASYLCAEPGAGLMRTRLGDVALQTLRYGERLRCGDAVVSLHPAGHVLGSAQIRIEAHGEVCVVSGDYKLGADPTCAAFEPVACRTFVTESTFGLPIYRWPPLHALIADIHAWWQENAAAGRCSLLSCYALGKAQRLLASIDAGLGPILVHGAIESVNRAYRAAGIALPATGLASAATDKATIGRALVLAPPSAAGSTWARRFGDASLAFASGWMLVRGARRQRRVEQGFALSDHADWPGLLAAIRDTGAERVRVTHGRADALVRYLGELGLQADALHLDYGEEEDAAATAADTRGTEGDDP